MHTPLQTGTVYSVPAHRQRDKRSLWSLSSASDNRDRVRWFKNRKPATLISPWRWGVQVLSSSSRCDSSSKEGGEVRALCCHANKLVFMFQRFDESTEIEVLCRVLEIQSGWEGVEPELLLSPSFFFFFFYNYAACSPDGVVVPRQRPCFCPSVI